MDINLILLVLTPSLSLLLRFQLPMIQNLINEIQSYSEYYHFWFHFGAVIYGNMITEIGPQIEFQQQL